MFGWPLLQIPNKKPPTWRAIKTHLFSTARHRLDVSDAIPAPNTNALTDCLTYLLAYLFTSYQNLLMTVALGRQKSASEMGKFKEENEESRLSPSGS